MTGNIDDVEMQGIIPRMVRTMFNRIEASSEQIEFTVKISMVEIYMEKIRDLINTSKGNLQVADVKGRGIWIQDVTETYVVSEDEVY